MGFGHYFAEIPGFARLRPFGKGWAFKPALKRRSPTARLWMRSGKPRSETWGALCFRGSNQGHNRQPHPEPVAIIKQSRGPGGSGRPDSTYLEKIKGEIATSSSLKDKLKYWNYARVLDFTNPPIRQRSHQQPGTGTPRVLTVADHCITRPLLRPALPT